MYARFEITERVCEESGGRDGSGGRGVRVAAMGRVGLARAIAPTTAPSRAVSAV